MIRTADVIAKDLLCGKDCQHCSSYINSKEAHCYKKMNKPISNVCDKWSASMFNMVG